MSDKNTNAMFVGGPKDGEWMVVPAHRDKVEVMEASPMAFGRRMMNPNEHFQTTTHEYFLKVIDIINDQPIGLLRHQSLSADEMWKRLLDCYQAKEER